MESHHERGSRERDRRRQPVTHSSGRNKERRKRKAMKNHLIAMSGEFVGTVLFLWFAFAGTQVAAMVAPGDPGIIDAQRLLYISLSFGMSLLVVVWAFYRISGGLFNPAVRLYQSNAEGAEASVNHSLTDILGHPRTLRGRSSPMDPWCFPASCRTTCRNRCCGSRFVHASWADGRLSDSAFRKHVNCPGYVSRTDTVL